MASSEGKSLGPVEAQSGESGFFTTTGGENGMQNAVAAMTAGMVSSGSLAALMVQVYSQMYVFDLHHFQIWTPLHSTTTYLNLVPGFPFEQGVAFDKVVITLETLKNQEVHSTVIKQRLCSQSVFPQSTVFWFYQKPVSDCVRVSMYSGGSVNR